MCTQAEEQERSEYVVPPHEPPATRVRKGNATGLSASDRPTTRRKLSSDLSDEECDNDELEVILAPEAVQEAKREVPRQNRIADIYTDST